MIRSLSLMALCGLLAACGSSAPPATPPSAPPAAAAQPTVIDPQLKALEKAKGVQDQADALKARTDATLKEGDGG